MKYTTKEVVSRPGMSREAALKSLQRAPVFTKGASIQDIYRKGNRWAAKIKVAEFPPAEDEDEGFDEPVTPDFGEEDDDSDDDVDDAPKDDGGDDKGSTDDQIIDLLSQILDAIGGGGLPLGGEDITDDIMGDTDLGPVPDELGLPEELTALASQFRQVAGKLPSVVISQPDNGQSIKQAKAEVEAAGKPYGYKVSRASREGGNMRVLASVR